MSRRPCVRRCAEAHRYLSVESRRTPRQSEMDGVVCEGTGVDDAYPV
jgi:hypothetical protein